MTLHVLRHVKSNQFNTQDEGELLRHLGFANAGWARKQERADRFFRPTKTRAGHFDRGRKRFDRLILTKDDVLEISIEHLQLRAIITRDRRRRDAGDLCNDIFDLVLANDLFLTALGQDALGCTGLVNHVNRFVRQMTVVNVLGS